MPVCGCTKHADFCSVDNPNVFKISTSKKFRVATVKKLREGGLLGERVNYLCVHCAQYCETNLLNNKSALIDSVIKAIEQNLINSDDIKRLAFAVGKSQTCNILEDSKLITDNYKEDFTQCFNNSEWLLKRNPVLLNFICGLCNISLDNCNGKTFGRLLSTIESVYSLRSKTLVLPFSFCKNLLSYFLTGSKNVCHINSILGPCGSYQTLLNHVQCHSREAIPINKTLDMITYFDNNQVIGRNWRLRHDAKATSSITTTIIHILPNSPTHIQQSLELSPRNWLHSMESSACVDSILKIIDHSEDNFRKLRRFFVTQRIEFVHRQQRKMDGEVRDEVDEMVSRRKRQKHDDDANINHDRSRTSFDVYGDVDHGDTKPPTVVMGDPVPVNPCSAASVRTVLETLSSKLLEERAWTIIGCDGLPYNIASKLIDGDDSLKDILLQPGLGHYEINMMFLKLTWDVVGSDLAKMLGFRSPKALAACLSGNDHHKAMQMMEILLYGLGDELLLPYVRGCIESEVTPSCDGFFQWTTTVKSANYRFLLDAIFTFAIALHYFRMGIRRNNTRVILATRVKFMLLFYGFNKVNYQQLDFADLKVRSCAPPTVLNFLQSTEAFSVSGHCSKAKGGDFILEAKNRATKSWLPPGSPTQDHWLRVCRNIDRLQKVKK